MARISLDELEAILRKHNDPVITAAGLADDLEPSRRHIAGQLELLERSGAVETKKVGGRARVWWHEDRVCRPRVAPEDHPDQSDLQHAAQPADATERNVGRETTDHRGEGSNDDLADDLAALDLPGGGALLDVRRENVRGCFELLRREGTATKSDFIDEVYKSDEFDRAGYETEAGWWNTIGKDGLKGLAERRDDFEAPSEGAHQWRFVGSE